MILIADGGSTKVDWVLIENKEMVARTQTKGANPYFRTVDDIAAELREDLLPLIGAKEVEAVRFFGAGCANAGKNEELRLALADVLQADEIEVGSDLLGAAKGLCGNVPGIVCILGTGSNSGYYDGNAITKNVSPLGYILGDEGSGAVIGRQFVGACLKNQFSPVLKEIFLKESGLTVDEIVEQVYRRPLPNRFLAGFCPFIHRYIFDKDVYMLVSDSFEQFFRRNAMQYPYEGQTLHFTGSVAFHFQGILRETAKKLHLTVGKIAASPMEGLVEYYTAENPKRGNLRRK